MEGLKPNTLIRLSKSCIGEAEKNAVMGVLDNGYLGMGSAVQKFENNLKVFFGREVVCVANGTAALQLALQASGVGPGDEVLVQSLTYVASFQAISATGALPVACDVDSSFVTLDWRKAEGRITERTKAIMPVHYGGAVGELDEIYSLAEKYSLRVIEDAAHAFGTKYNNKIVGSFGDIACFSFDGIKNITSGEGGCVVTSDKEVLQKIQDSRLLGVERDTEKRYSSTRSWEFQVNEQGWRYHMSDIMAAIGLEQLKRFPEFSLKRKSLASHYDNLLKGSGLIEPLIRDYSSVVPHIYVVRIKNGKSRNLLQQQLLQIGIQTGIHYKPNHTLNYYRTESPYNLKVTDQIYPELLSLPMHPDLNFKDIELICRNLLSLLRN